MPILSPQTLTCTEQAALLAVTAAHPRDHLTFSMALGTGLRLSEIVGLDVGDVYSPAGQPKSRVRVRAEIAKGGRAADVFLPNALVGKLRAFRDWKLAHNEALDPGAPLFCNQGRRRISKRRVQIAFKAWQMVAGFDRHYSFHCLRHTAVTSVYRMSRDLFLAQRFARHASPLTTVVYTHHRTRSCWRGCGGWSADANLHGNWVVMKRPGGAIRQATPPYRRTREFPCFLEKPENTLSNMLHHLKARS